MTPRMEVTWGNAVVTHFERIKDKETCREAGRDDGKGNDKAVQVALRLSHCSNKTRIKRDDTSHCVSTLVKPSNRL